MYRKGPVGAFCVRLSRLDVSLNSKTLLDINAHIPSDFARKPHFLHEVLLWKATELHSFFLLYLGFLVLEDILSDELFQHFMLLFVAIRILVSPHLAMLHCDHAGSLLYKFVRDAVALLTAGFWNAR